MNNLLKIVHCANFSQHYNGKVFYATDRKITYGLMSQGHFVYDFSYRDIARAHRFLGFKKRSIDKMNQDLITTCKNIEPDLLLLAKAEFVYPSTLLIIKKLYPKMKIAKWFVDFLDREGPSFFEQFNFIDFFCQTSAAELPSLHKKFPHLVCGYMPNITEPVIDKPLFDTPKEYDIIYIARDHKEDVRYKFALELEKFCTDNNLNLKIYGSLGNPTIFGMNYYREISKAKIAINFNREDLLEGENKQKFMGSSDRMNHFMGVGTCTFSPKINGLDMLYENEKDIIYFDGIEDCFLKIKSYLDNKTYDAITLKGNTKAYAVSNARKVTKFMLETIFEQPYSEVYEWQHLVYKRDYV
ncbi:MAG: hypothetical protein KU29_01595 [Sulfurovum sp. FS06-10]|nr:MAG: hypothetical protein KU29_01595 [Sulfurovum sp. FS06-10]